MPWIDRWKRPPNALTFWLLLATCFAGTDVVLNSFAIGLGWTMLWPLNGITVALLLRTPRRRWLWLLLAVEAGTGFGEYLTGNSLPREVCERLCSALEVMFCAVLLPSFASVEAWLGKPRIVRRVLAALLLGPAISGVPAALCLHLLAGEPLVAAWRFWATPDMLGIAVTLPVALMLRTPEMRALFSPGRAVATLSILAGSALLALLLFSFDAYPLLFLFYPILLYVDWKLSFAGASLALFLSSVVGVFCTVHGLGPFGHWQATLTLPRESALQIYLGFHAVALLPLSLVMMERKNIAGQLRRANARLESLTRQDALTGIANRRAFDEAFALAWDDAVAQGAPLSMLMLDIDHFKQYNDRHGHLEGDACLVRVAEVLCGALTMHDRVARYGGEEFVVLLPGSNMQACFRTAETLRREVVRAGIAHPGSDWGIVTISAGCATTLPAANTDRRSLLTEADRALYQAKESGRNRLASPLADRAVLHDTPRALHPQEVRQAVATAAAALELHGVLRPAVG